MFDNLPNDQESKPAPVKRPVGLTVICILTFIFSGLLLISNLFYSLNYNNLPGYFNNLLEVFKNSAFKDAVDIESLKVFFKVLAETSIWYYILSTVLCGATIGGAMLMFRLRKIGFHFYAISQILSLMLPLIYLQGYKPDISNIAVTAVFILLYASNLRLMK